MNKPDVKKLILLNLPYVFAFYFADKIAAVFRLTPGAAFIDKLTNGFAVFGSAFANPLPSFHPSGIPGAQRTRIREGRCPHKSRRPWMKHPGPMR